MWANEWVSSVEGRRILILMRRVEGLKEVEWGRRGWGGRNDGWGRRCEGGSSDKGKVSHYHLERAESIQRWVPKRDRVIRKVCNIMIMLRQWELAVNWLLLTKCFPDLHATVLADLPLYTRILYWMQVSTLLPPKWLARGNHWLERAAAARGHRRCEDCWSKVGL